MNIELNLPVETVNTILVALQGLQGATTNAITRIQEQLPTTPPSVEPS